MTKGKKNGSSKAAKGKARSGFEIIEVPTLPVVKLEGAGETIEGRLDKVRHTTVKGRPATVLDMTVDGEQVSYFAGGYVKRAIGALSPERIKQRPKLIITRLTDEEDEDGAIPHEVQVERERTGRGDRAEG